MKTKLQLLIIIILYSLTGFSQGYNAYLFNEIDGEGGMTASQAGQVFTFTLDVQNNSDDLLYEYSVTASIDNMAGTIIPSDLTLIAGDLNNNSLLDVNETWTYTTTYTVSQSDIDNTAMPNGVGLIRCEVIIANFYNGNYTEIPITNDASLSIVDDDGDGVINDTEVNDNTNYTDGCDFILASQTITTTTAWNDADCDGDGMSNGYELDNGTDPLVFNEFDNDGDGVVNSQETIDETDPYDGCDFNAASITQMPSNAWMDADCDGDGIVNEAEGWDNQDSDGDNILNINDIDDDNDGILTIVEYQHGNTDGDSLPNYLDTDSDNDNIPDNVEAQSTNDYVAPSGIDSNNDGLDDAYDIGLSYNLINTDSDPNNVYDYIDIDSDDDGFLDIDEGVADDDGDGIPNYRDVSCIPVGFPVDVVVCSEETINIDLEAITSGENNTFTWVATDNSDVSGETLTSSSSNFISNVLVNNSNTVQDVVYTIVPISADFCEGDAFQIVVVVEPMPLGTDYSVTIDSGNQLSVVLDNLVNISNTTFSWVAIDNVNVTGETLTNLVSGVINDTLFNSTETDQLVEYIVTPTSFNGCLGNSFTITVTVAPTCEVPTNLSYAFINTDSVSINWTTGGSETSWQLRFEGIIIDLTTQNYVFTNLLADTNYTFELRSVCDIDNYSEWIIETFHTAIIPPVCGEIFTDDGGTNNNYSNNEDSIITIYPEIAGEVVNIIFTSFETESGYDSLKIYDGESVDGNLIETLSGSPSNLPLIFTSTDSTGALTFKFHSDSSVNKSGWVASVICGNLPTCLPITNITIENAMADYASVDFIDLNFPQTNFYEIEYGVTGFTHGNGTTFYTTTLTGTMNNLVEGTTYDVYIRTDCSSTNTSDWSNVITFTKTPFCDTPIGDTIQYFQAVDNPTVFDLIEGLFDTNIFISNSSDCSVSALPETTPLINGTTYYVYRNECCDFLEIIVSITDIIDLPYDISYIPFQNYGQPLVNTINVDDGYTNAIDLGFKFNFFGIDYSQVFIGTNSVISFDVADNGAFCEWAINPVDQLPSANIIDNAILGGYQDFDNRGGSSGVQAYGLIGTAPFRKFVLFFDQVSMYSCNDIQNTNQSILYETYNFIDVQIKDRDVCTSWNSGSGIVGIQSIDGQYAYTAPNRNTGDWEAHNEGYRFKPENNLPDYQYIICDTDGDGIESFDLLPVYNYFDDGTGDVVSLYLSIEDAQNNTNQISTPFTNTENTQVIFCSITDSVSAEVVIKRVLLATIDCNADYDLDTVETMLEDLNNNGNFGDDDTDGDQIPDFIDEDDDGDFVLTNVEAVVTNRNTQEFLDTDGDQIPNYLDDDDDGDGVLTINEDYDGDHNPANDDTNNDGIDDYLQESVALGINQENIVNFNIYPNPVNKKLKVEFNTILSDVTLQIFNLQGQVVYSKSNISNSINIDVSTFNNGVYFIKFNNKEQSLIRKFIKE